MADKKTSSGTISRLTRKADKSKDEKIQTALYQIADAASAMTDMQEFYAALHQIVRELMYAENFYVTLYDPATRIISAPYFADKAGDAPPPPSRLEKYPKSLRAHVLRTGRTLHLSGEEIEEGKRRGVFEPMGTSAEDWIGVPLKMGRQTIGSLTIQSYQKGVRYTEQDVQLLEFVAQHISVALTRARAIDETRQRNAELAIINSVQEALASKLDMQAIYDLVGDRIRDIFNNMDISIRIYDVKTNLIHYPYTYENGQRIAINSFLLPERGFGPHVLRTRESLMINENMLQEIEKYGSGIVPGTLTSKSLVMVPLVADNQARGLITLNDMEHEQAFSDSDVRLLETLANSMGIALENARLFDETQRLLKETKQRADELAIINGVQEGLASRLDIQAIYELVGEKIRETFNAQVVSIVTYDRATGLTQSRYYFEQGRGTPNITLPAFGFRKYVLENQEPIVVNEDMSHWMEVYDNPILQGVQPKSAIFVPMIAGAEAIGVISLQNNDQENAFSDADLRLLTTLSNSMSVALENARLFDKTQRLLKETEQRSAELAIINSVQEGLASKLEMQGIYDLVGDKIREIFDANTVTLVTFDLDKNLLHLHYIIEKGQRLFIEPIPIPEIYMNFIRRGQPLLINNKITEYIEEVDPGFKQLAGEMPRSVLAVPLMMKGEMFGLITLQNIDRENAFSESDMRLLQTLANSMSVALENARLWEQEKLYRRALERELEIGREIQAGFLPETLPQVEGWEIAAALMSAREVAGDFYDAFELPDGNIGLVIADVCDKGVGAALYMTLFRSLVRVTSNLENIEHAGLPHSTPERLKRAMVLTNNYIVETHGDSGMFATLFFGILDPRDGKLSYINGGHEPPLIVRSGLVRETLRKTGPAVGAITNARFELLETYLQEGDTFFAFTDGVPDCVDPHGEFFGRERLLDILHRNNASAHELVSSLESELCQYVGSGNQFDDITLLAVKRLRTT
jgi:serine phosphatase RsbU (regulator of sigma subunit)